MRTLRAISLVGTTLLLFSVGPLAASANLLINGGFDNPTLPVNLPTAVLDTISVAAVSEPSHDDRLHDLSPA